MPNYPFRVCTPDEWKRALADARARRASAAQRLKAELDKDQEKQKLANKRAIDQTLPLPGF